MSPVVALCELFPGGAGNVPLPISGGDVGGRYGKAFTSAAQTAVSDLSKQAGSVSDSFSSALRNERSEMQRFRRRLFWISLLPTAITLASLIASLLVWKF